MTQKEKVKELQDKTHKLEIYYSTMNEKLDNLCDKVDKIDKKLDAQEKKFAGRWVEVVAVGVLIAIIAQLALA